MRDRACQLLIFLTCCLLLSRLCAEASGSECTLELSRKLNFLVKSMTIQAEDAGPEVRAQQFKALEISARDLWNMNVDKEEGVAALILSYGFQLSLKDKLDGEQFNNDMVKVEANGFKWAKGLLLICKIPFIYNGRLGANLDRSANAKEVIAFVLGNRSNIEAAEKTPKSVLSIVNCVLRCDENPASMAIWCLGSAYLEMGDRINAKKYFRDVISTYPNSSLANSAKGTLAIISEEDDAKK